MAWGEKVDSPPKRNSARIQRYGLSKLAGCHWAKGLSRCEALFMGKSDKLGLETSIRLALKTPKKRRLPRQILIFIRGKSTLRSSTLNEHDQINSGSLSIKYKGSGTESLRGGVEAFFMKKVKKIFCELRVFLDREWLGEKKSIHHRSEIPQGFRDMGCPSWLVVIGPKDLAVSRPFSWGNLTSWV